MKALRNSIKARCFSKVHIGFLFPLIGSGSFRSTILILSIVAALENASASGQVVVKGRIIDAESSEPVIAAHIIKPDSTGTYSGKDGYFELKVNRLPVDLIVRHLSYGESVVTLSDPLPDPLVIRIRQQISQIGEVQVTAQRLRILTEREDFTLQDFAFDNQNLWMIGYLNNQATKGRLWLAGWYGDTIRSIPVRGAEKLSRDLFGNVQLYVRDSVYQLYGERDTIILAYGYGRNEFAAAMEPFQASFNNRLVYSRLSEMGFARDVYCLGENLAQPIWLTRIEDSLGRRDFRLWLKVGGMAPRNLNIASPMFSLNDSLYIVNVIKDSLLVYGPEGRYAGSRPFGFHKARVLGVPEYYDFDFCPDPIGSLVYILDHRKNIWSLVRLDPETGRTGQPLPLPDYPGMSRITPFANAVYFLYTEKKYPFYTRLYRMQI